MWFNACVMRWSENSIGLVTQLDYYWTSNNKKDLLLLVFVKTSMAGYQKQIMSTIKVWRSSIVEGFLTTKNFWTNIAIRSCSRLFHQCYYKGWDSSLVIYVTLILHSTKGLLSKMCPLKYIQISVVLTLLVGFQFLLLLPHQ
jgi:hypothetical protein